MNEGNNTATRPGSLFEYMAGNHIAVWLTTVLLLGLGLYALLNTTVERFPTLDFRTIVATVPYDGATPREVEEDVILRIEESLVGIDGVERITSNAWEGSGEVIIEFVQWQDMTARLDEVRTAIESIEDFPPLGADEAEIVKQEVMRGVVSLVMTSDTAAEADLRLAADELREELLLLPGVGFVDLLGAREREFQVALDETRLRSHQLNVGEVVSLIRGSSLNLSGGTLLTDSGNLVLSTLEKRYTAEEFEDIVILSRADGSIVRLGDIATLRDGFVEDPLLNTVDGASAVFIEVSAPSGINPQDVRREVENRLAAYDSPPGIELDLWMDTVVNVNKPLTSVAGSAITGIALVFITLILLLDLRIAIWVAIGIPTAIVGSFIFLFPMGQTLHIMSVIGFAIVVGIVVDDAIVVAENIARYRESGMPAQQASITGAREVMAPVIVGVMTTVFVFLALIPLDGAIGQMFSKIGILVFAVLMFSLLDAFFLLPAHISGTGQLALWPLIQLQRTAKEGFDGFIENRMAPAIGYSIRRPWTIVLVFFVMAAVAAGLFQTNVLRFNSLGNRLDEQQLQLDLTLTPGSTFQDSLRAAEQIVGAAREANSITGGTAVNAIAVLVGQHKPMETSVGLTAADPGANLASVQLRLNTFPEREISVAELRNVWLESIGTIQGAEKIAFPQASGYASAGIGLVLQHPDDEQLLAAATELKRRLVEHEPIYEIADTLELGKRRYEIQLTDTGGAAGLNPALLAVQLRNRFFGFEAQRIVRNQDELKVMARYPIENRLSPADLQDERINLPGGRLAAFSDVAVIEETQELAQRQRVDGLPAVSITSNFNVAATSTRELGGLVLGQWLPELQQTYPGLRSLPDGSSRDTRKILEMLSVTFPAALLLMFALISIQLRSVLQPLYILVSIPVTIAGVFYLHVLLGYDLGLVSIFGTVAVTGIVVNDGLVFLDMYNRIRRNDPGLEVESAILQAARIRARPILLTSITTIVGLLPLLYNRAESVEPFLAVFVSLVGGLMFAGISLLLLMPAIMALFEKRPGAQQLFRS